MSLRIHTVSAEKIVDALLEADEDEIKASVLHNEPDYPFRLKYGPGHYWKVIVQGIIVGSVEPTSRTGRLGYVALPTMRPSGSEVPEGKVYQSKRAAAKALIDAVRHTIPAKIEARKKAVDDLFTSGALFRRELKGPGGR